MVTDSNYNKWGNYVMTYCTRNIPNMLTHRKFHFQSNFVINDNNTVPFLCLQYQISLIIFPEIGESLFTVFLSDQAKKIPTLNTETTRLTVTGNLQQYCIRHFLVWQGFKIKLERN